jgi:hypothetical protein
MKLNKVGEKIFVKEKQNLRMRHKLLRFLLIFGDLVIKD